MRRSIVKSASRTLEVLELFSEQRRPLRLHEVYEHLHYPQSSATNLLRSMVMMGYLNYNRATRTYIPTGKVGSLGNWMASFMYGATRYHNLVSTLQERTNETAALATQNDLFIQYFIIKTPKHEFKMPPNEGSMRLLTRASMGMALLSRMTNRDIDKVCRHINYYELEACDRVDISQLLKEIGTIRQRGYAYAPHQPNPGISSIALPMSDTMHGIPLALGVGGLYERLAARKEEIIGIIRETIDEFEAQSKIDAEEEGEYWPANTPTAFDTPGAGTIAPATALQSDA